jgi:uncharacterized protein
MNSLGTQESGLASPCNSVCRMSPSTGFCEGCFRTINEIVAWGQLAEAEKAAIWRELANRKSAHVA